MTDLPEIVALSDEALSTTSVEDLTALTAAHRAAAQPLVADAAPPAENIARAQEFSAEIERIAGELSARAERTAAAAGLREAFSAPTEPDVEPEPETEPEPEPEAAPVEEAAVEEAAVVASAPSVATIPVARPVVRNTGAGVTLTAATDVPGYPTGSTISDMDGLGQALVARMQGFPEPAGDGNSEDLRQFGVAMIRRSFPEELTIDRHSDDMEVLSYAARESRLDGGSLTASGGWCSPSETLYDLCEPETTEGIISIPEVNVKRGGIKFTKGPDFSDIFTNVGFAQTEAQAIAGVAKTCYEVPCPTWTDTRLDAVGLCIKAPILTNAAYPELVQRWLRGSMVAHQHKVSTRVISAIQTSAGAARVLTDMTTTAGSTFGGVELLADQLRQKYKMSLTATMEVLLPFWVKGALRSDLALRMGNDLQAVTDQMIQAEFAARRVNVQFLYNWQELTVTDLAYPATFDVIMYPAGTFVKGVSDIIKLAAVYDAASLVTNIYTALFFEEGVLVANFCNNAVRATLAVCNSGHTGSSNIAVCNHL